MKARADLPGRLAPTRRVAAWWRVALLAVWAASALEAQLSDHALRFYGTGVGPPGQQDRVLIPVDDNVAGTGSSPIDVGSGSFTLEWWMRGALADNTTSNGGGDVHVYDYSWIDGNIILDRDVWCGTQNAWGVSIAGGFVRFGVDAGDAGGGWTSTIEGDVDVLDGAWHHVAVVRDAAVGQLRIVVDGVLDFETATGDAHVLDLSYPDAGVAVTPGNCDPGQLTPYGWYLVIAAEKHDAGAAYPSYAGFFDELRIWNTARTVEQVAANRFVDLPAQTGLVGEYRFEEGTGTIVGDTSGAAEASPDGDLIAGSSGNGEWMARIDDPFNTAPIGSATLIFVDGFESGNTLAWN